HMSFVAHSGTSAVGTKVDVHRSPTACNIPVVARRNHQSCSIVPALRYCIRNERSPKAPSARPAQDVTTSLAENLRALGADPQVILDHPDLRAADAELLTSSLSALSDWVPRRSLGALLERHPPLLTAPLGAWADFLASFGFQRLAIQELFLNSPDVITSSSVYRAGQVFLFLRQLGLRNEEIVGPIFRWRALLVEEADYQSAASFLASEGGVPDELLPRVASTYPGLLAAPVEGELRPRLQFLKGLGPEASRLLRGFLWEDWCGWIHGLANWSTAVAPKLVALEDLLPGGRPAAEALLREVPEALKCPPESRLVPNLRLLTGRMGIQGESLFVLLCGAPAILSLPPEQLESRWVFLLEAANGSKADLLAYPPYLLASLSKVTGPRFFYITLRGLTSRFMNRAFNGGDAVASESGRRGREVGAGFGIAGSNEYNLDLRWLCEGSDDEWLKRMALEQRAGPGGGGWSAAPLALVVGMAGEARTASHGQEGAKELAGQQQPQWQEAGLVKEELLLLRGDYDEVLSEWDSLLGWCCDKAFTERGCKRFEEQLSLFYLLIQGRM
ncbi:hypothetical protein Vretimale_1682, partial [Volvox reticuliferus]